MPNSDGKLLENEPRKEASDHSSESELLIADASQSIEGSFNHQDADANAQDADANAKQGVEPSNNDSDGSVWLYRDMPRANYEDV